MVVKDLYKAMNSQQHVIIYTCSKHYVVFSDVCSAIPGYFMDLSVKHFYASNDKIVITV